MALKQSSSLASAYGPKAAASRSPKQQARIALILPTSLKLPLLVQTPPAQL